MGVIADAFSETLFKMCDAQAFRPTKLYAVSPGFCDDIEHDAQEFLCYFLDGLHEDVNQSIPDRTETPDYKDGDDALQSLFVWK